MMEATFAVYNGNAIELKLINEDDETAQTAGILIALITRYGFRADPHWSGATNETNGKPTMYMFAIDLIQDPLIIIAEICAMFERVGEYTVVIHRKCEAYDSEERVTMALEHPLHKSLGSSGP